MPAESHCSIMWPEPRPQRSEQLLQTQKHTGTHTKDMHTHTHAHKWKKKKKKIQNESKQMVNMRRFIPN